MQASNDTPGVYPDDFAEFEAARQPGTPKATPSEDSPKESETAGESETQDDKEQTDGDTAEGGEGEDEGEKPKSKRGIDKRFRELTSKIRGLEAALAAAKPESTPEVAKPAASAPAEGKPVAGNFETYEEYTEALTLWTIDQRESKRAADQSRKQLEAAQNEAAAQWDKRLDEARKKLEDFDELVLENDQVNITDAMKQAIFEADRGPEVAYFLAQNPAEAERIAKLSPVAAVRAIGKIEDGLTPKAKAAPTTKPKVSSAPAPITPSSRPAANSAKKPLGEVSDYAEYERRRAAGER